MMESNESHKVRLFEFLEHGDESHRQWLKKAINAYFDGTERPKESNPDTSKIIPKGTKIKFHCCTHDMGSDESYEDVLQFDETENSLEDIAEQFANEQKQLEWFWEVIKSKNS